MLSSNAPCTVQASHISPVCRHTATAQLMARDGPLTSTVLYMHTGQSADSSEWGQIGRCILGAVTALGGVALSPIGGCPLATLMQMEQGIQCRIHIQPAPYRQGVLHHSEAEWHWMSVASGAWQPT